MNEVTIYGLTQWQIIELRKFWLQNHEDLPIEPTKQKKLVEVKCYESEVGNLVFSDVLPAFVKKIPYTIKDGKIFIEVEEQ